MRSIVLITLALLTNLAWADGEAEYKYRESVMTAVRGHMGSMGAILRGRVHFDDLKIHANSMADLAKIVPHIFPEGSNVDGSESLPAIWEKPAEFQSAMQKFVDAANGIAEAANSGEMSEIGPAMQALGQSCKGCHDDFRAEH